MPGRESALIVAVPQAEPLVARWRQQYDEAAAAGVPAHITVLYPFLEPSRLDDAVLGALARLFGAFDAFPFSLTVVRRFADDVLYLAPEPAAPFSDLTTAVERRFRVRAYGGTIEDPIPHLTVADGASPDVFDRVEAAVAPGLPIPSRAAEVALIVQDDAGRWHERRRFALRGPVPA